MPRPARPSELTINHNAGVDTSGLDHSPINVDLSSFGGDFGGSLSSLPPLPSSPPTSPRHHRDPSKNFLSNFKHRTTTEQEHPQQQGGIRQVMEDDDTVRAGSGSMSKIYHFQTNPGSTPELSLVGSAGSMNKSRDVVDNSTAQPARPHPSPYHSEENVTAKRKDKAPRNLLGRSKSVRRDSHTKSKPEVKPLFEHPPQTAPQTAPFYSADLPGSNMSMLGAKGKRGKSSERAVLNGGTHSSSEPKSHAGKDKDKEKDKGGFMSGGKNTINKVSKGGGSLFTRLGKIGRSSSNSEKEIPDSEYQLKIINLPLVEQTRITRISKDLASCRDKTEYWMPSLPWRCIDYLNLNCESEGLYRIPGSGPQVKAWQRRFDTEHDVDLLSEEDLYDPNNIGSMLKSWLRELPTEIMSSGAQASLAAVLKADNPLYAQMGQPAPQKLRDALSDLSPFNYYLLFAITCHLSLLLSHKEKNKMGLENLAICIGPPLRLERWLFNYLVGDWRHCWQGCFTEKVYLESEKKLEQGSQYRPPSSQGDDSSRENSMANLTIDDRAVHSSGSGSGTSNPASHYEDARPTQQDDGELRWQENMKPDTYKPAGGSEFNNGGVTMPFRGLPQIDVRRPSTAEDKQQAAEPNFRNGLPRQASHGRSKSDVPTTPIKISSGADHTFPMPGRA